jgi:hypothetical protein
MQRANSGRDNPMKGKKNVWWGVQSVKLVIVAFQHSLVTLISLGTNIFYSISFSSSLNGSRIVQTTKDRLRHYATNRKDVGSIPVEVIFKFT